MSGSNTSKWIGGTVGAVLIGLIITAIWQAPTVLATKSEIKEVRIDIADNQTQSAINTLELIRQLREYIQDIKRLEPDTPKREKKIEKIEKRIEGLEGNLVK